MEKRFSLDDILHIDANYACNYNNTEIINIDNLSISSKLIIDLIVKKDYYDYILKIINKGLSNLIIRREDTKRVVSLSRADIVRGISLVIDNYSFNNEEMERIKYLTNITSFDYFNKLYNNSSYEIMVDNKKYEIKVSDIMKVLLLSESDFYNLCINNSINEISNIEKSVFLYISNQFFKKNNIGKKFIFPDNVLNNINVIDNNQLIDIQAINSITNTVDNNIDMVKVNSALRDEILKDMPNDFNNLEKAIYIYIKICKLLSYDEKYYIDKEGAVAKMHQDINYIREITPENNKVLCYELNAIYSSFLKELGINYQSISHNAKNEDGSYGKAHAELEFRYEKFIIVADSVKTVFNADLVRAKVNEKLQNFYCKNKNKDTITEFNNMLKKVYTYITQLEGKSAKYLNEDLSFEDILDGYQKITEQETQLSFKYKLNMLIDKVNMEQLKGLDNLAYLLHVARIIFKDDKDIQITIFKNNIDNTTTGVITNIIGEDNYKYYLYNPNSKLIPLDGQALQKMFDNKDYEILNLNMIPGIKVGGKRL